MNITLNEEAASKIEMIQTQLQKYGMENIDLGEIVSATVLEAKSDFWENLINNLVPIELKIKSAASDPKLQKLILEVIERHSKPKKPKKVKRISERPAIVPAEEIAVSEQASV